MSQVLHIAGKGDVSLFWCGDVCNDVGKYWSRVWNRTCGYIAYFVGSYTVTLNSVLVIVLSICLYAVAWIQYVHFSNVYTIFNIVCKYRAAFYFRSDNSARLGLEEGETLADKTDIFTLTGKVLINFLTIFMIIVIQK